jgi:polyhydroxybutyrate depolymerase
MAPQRVSSRGELATTLEHFRLTSGETLMKRVFAVTALLFATLSCGDGSEEPALIANGLNTLTHDGVARTFLLHVPPGLSDSRPVPLVVGLHGYTASSSAFEGQSGLSVKADAEGFIVAYPDGLRYPWTASNPQAWNAGGRYEGWTGGTDDVGFIAQVIDEVRRHYAIDPARIYVTGHSNGSFMAYRVGHELSCTIAAIAPHSGPVVYESPTPPRCPVSTLHLHAINDSTVSYAGRYTEDPNQMVSPAVEVGMARWASLFGCGTSPEVTATYADSSRLQWRCPGASPTIELVRTSRGGHEWLRVDNSGVAGTDLIWEFFKAHPKR